MSGERADVARLIPRISPSLAVTAWYLPVGGGVGPGQSGYLLDAFSVAHGDFVDDSFVDVTSDPSLTSDANVAAVKKQLGWLTRDPGRPSWLPGSRLSGG
jgi:hypothetical protein